MSLAVSHPCPPTPHSAPLPYSSHSDVTELTSDRGGERVSGVLVTELVLPSAFLLTFGWEVTTPEESFCCFRMFLLYLARAFWNHTCRARGTMAITMNRMTRETTIRIKVTMMTKTTAILLFLFLGIFFEIVCCHRSFRSRSGAITAVTTLTL